MWKESTLRNNLGKAAKKYGLRMPQIQLLLCQERFLMRLYSLEEGRRFIWKGGSLILRLYPYLEQPRFTVDLDLLAQGFMLSKTAGLFKEAVKLNLADGFSYGEITRSEFKRETPYGGDRYEISWRFFNREQSETLKIDVCAGDTVEPVTVRSESLLIMPETEIEMSFLVYPAEYIFAEKLETAIRFYTGNTRLKDFVDMWTLIHGQMDLQTLKEAIRNCFSTRHRELNAEVWKVLLHDKTFIEVMERSRTRKFKHLSVPPVEKMFSDIETFLMTVNP